MNNIQKGMMNSPQIKDYLQSEIGLDADTIEVLSLCIADNLVVNGGYYLKGWHIVREMYDNDKSTKEVLIELKSANLKVEDKRFKM